MAVIGPETRLDQNNVRTEEWFRGKTEAGMESYQIVGELMQGGASIVNYSGAEEPFGVAPYTKADGTVEVVIARTDAPVSLRFNKQRLGICMNNASTTPAIDAYKTSGLVLVPFPRFTTEGQLDASRSRILLLPDYLAEEIKQFISEV